MFGRIRRVAGLTLALALFTAAPGRADSTTGPTRPYENVAKALERLIEHEMKDKELPGLSIALVDDQTIVWARGFGLANPSDKVPATADTVYRVGSISKLFTDIAVMQLADLGKLDLDAPVTQYLPGFKPGTRFNKPITLRHLMSHRSGLVREPPVGNYFDTTSPPLAKMVESLNKTDLVYAPEAKTKYSNAAVATVGYVLEKTQNEPVAKYLQRVLLEPLRMTRSAFEPTDAVRKDLARGLMWTYHGRTFDAPTFELGMIPAGCMYSTVNDLGRFVSALFAIRKSPNDPFLKDRTLQAMWKPQFAKPGEKTGFGLGFHIEELDGLRRIGHDGAIYGFSAELGFLPDERLGVIVACNKDMANAVVREIADTALRQMLAVKQNKPLPEIVFATALDPAAARRLAGHYQNGTKGFDLVERTGKLWVVPTAGGFRVELRSRGDVFVTDDLLDQGTEFRPQGDDLAIEKRVFRKVEPPKPPPASARYAGLIGEYGWDHDILYILEKDGKLHALIEWFFLYPLEEVSENVYKFPETGLYMGEKLVFTRKNGRATQVEAASVVFPRRPIDGENGETFRIQAVRPLDELRKEALAAKPPPEKADFRKPDLVDVLTLDATIKLDIRYATTNNFLSTPFYTSAKAFLQRPAAEAMVRVHKKLAQEGYGLLIHDGYRPWYVTRMFWDATPEKFHLFVADPQKGSRHNRGCAVDLTLFDRKTGKPIDMVGGYDEFSDRSYPDYFGGTTLQRWHRDLLRRAMEAEGFTVYEAEWWHFDYKDWRAYPILNQTFEELAAAGRK